MTRTETENGSFATAVGSAPPPRSDALADTVAAGAPVDHQPEPDPLVGSMIDRYRVEARLGAGGMGVVYAAHDPALDRKVALKLLPALAGTRRGDLEHRLRREAQALARLAHPNVVAVHDVGVAAHSLFVAMQLVDGTTLGEWLDAEPRPERAVLEVFVAAARGLAAAHEAGIVHRDFKPSNVLIDRAGRVFVSDFGLARGADEPELAVSASGSLLDEQLTHAGAVLGTPLYMSPEQHHGEPADARSDQFSFCVSLWLALFGSHPFVDERWNAATATAAMARDAVREPARRRRVQPRVQRALRRGLLHDPAARWPAMDALRAELEPRSRAGWVFGGMMVGGIVAAVALTAQVTGATPQATTSPCAGARDRLAGIWDPARAGELAAAFTSLDPRIGAVTAGEVTTRFDHYATAWVSAHQAACQARVVRGATTPAWRDVKLACLERRRAALGATIDALLDQPDHSVLHRARARAATLEPIEHCGDEDTLAAVTPPPDDPAARARIDELWGEFYAIEATSYRGRAAAARAELVALLPSIRTAAHAPLEAEALVLLGAMESAEGRSAEARRALEEALTTAGAARDDVLMTQALLRLYFLLVTVVEDDAAADAYERLAMTLVERTTRLDLRARFHDYRGVRHAIAGRRDEAIHDGERAVELWARAAGASGLNLGAATTNLATFHLDAGRHARANELYGQARAILSEAVGDEHPEVSVVLINQGSLLVELGDPRAVEVLDHAERIGIATAGERSATVGGIRAALARALLADGALERADAAVQSAIELIGEHYGAGHQEALLQRETWVEILLARGDVGRAVTVIEEALGPVEASGDHEIAGFLHVAHARALLAAGRGRAAAAAAETAVTRLSAAVDPWRTATARFERARAWWATGARARGVAEARAARPALVEAGPIASRRLAELDAWLAAPGRAGAR